MTSRLEHPPRRNSASLTRDTVEGARKRARVMALEIARQSVGGTGKAIRTWAIARYYVDVRDVSSIILIAEITVASTAPTALSFYSLSYPMSRDTYASDFLVCIFMSSFVIKIFIIISKSTALENFYFTTIQNYISQR